MSFKATSQKFIEQLRYPSPENNLSLIRSLADLIDVPVVLTRGGDPVNVASAMAGVVMYRHLNRRDKMQVMEMINSLPNKKLAGKLRERVTDVIVNPRWVIWSLTKEELQDVIEFHSIVGDVSNWIGANPGAYGVGGYGWSLIKQARAGASKAAMRSNIVGLIVSIVLMGVCQISSAQLKRYDAELDSRKQFIK